MRRPRRGEVQSRRAELSSRGVCVVGRFVTMRAQMRGRRAAVVRAHDCVRSNGPNDVNGALHSDIRAGKIQISVEEISLRHQRESDANQWRWIYGVCNK